MKKLSKVLSLVLVIAMVFSLCVIGASAKSFTDTDKVTADYKEAVDVVSDLGIIQGMTTTTFEGQGTLTRAQACALIARMTLGVTTADNMTVSGVKFTDVPATFWGYKYVQYCANAGIVSGVGANKFAPNATLTGYQFAKMLMAALGVDVSECVGANWAITTAQLFYKLGFSDVVITNDPLAREAATQMVYDAMFYTSNGKTGYPVKDANGDIIAVYDTVAEATMMKAALGAGYTIGSTEVTIGGTTLAKTVFGVTRNTEGYNGFGEPATIYTTAKKAQATTYGWRDTTYSTAAKTVAISPVKTYSAADLTKTEATALTKAAWDFSNANVYYNGSVGVKTVTDLTNGDLAKPGYIVELFGKANANGGYTVSRVVVKEYYLAQVTNIAATSKNVSLTVREAGYYLGHSKTYMTVVIDAPTATNVTPSANYSMVSSLAKNDYALICVKPGWENSLTILDLVKPTTVTGTVTATGYTGNFNGYIKIDGTKTTLAWEYDQTDITLGSKYDFYTDANGYIYGASVISEATTDLVYVTKTEAYYTNTLGGNTYAKASVVFADGTVGTVNVYVSAAGYINGDSSDPITGYTNSGAIAKTPVDTWYSYVKQADGSYKFVGLPTGYNQGSMTITKGGAATSVAGAVANSATVLNVVSYNATTKTATVSSYTGYANFPAVTGDAAYKTNANTSVLDSITIYTTSSVTSTAKFGYCIGAGDYDAAGQHYNFVVDSAVVSYVCSGVTAPVAGTAYQVTATGTATATVTAVANGTTVDTTTYYNGVGTIKYVDPSNSFVIVTIGGNDVVYYTNAASTFTSVVGIEKGVAPSAATPVVNDTVTIVGYKTVSTGPVYTAAAFITAHA